jgi:hypothetical protein
MFVSGYSQICVFFGGGVGEYSFAISTSTSGSRRSIFGVRCFTSQSCPLCAGNSFFTKKGFVQELGFLC